MVRKKRKCFASLPVKRHPISIGLKSTQRGGVGRKDREEREKREEERGGLLRRPGDSPSLCLSFRLWVLLACLLASLQFKRGFGTK